MSEINSDNYILFIPGGIGTRELVKNESFINNLKLLSQKAEYIITVCTGSILFSKTGLLNNRKATSNKRIFFWAKNESPEVIWIKKAHWIKDGNIYILAPVLAPEWI
jgi:putative intracellular protease/amidase